MGEVWSRKSKEIRHSEERVRPSGGKMEGTHIKGKERPQWENE